LIKLDQKLEFKMFKCIENDNLVNYMELSITKFNISIVKPTCKEF